MKLDVHKATIPPRVRDLDWAAGFLDGDGCFSVSKGVGTDYHYSVICTQMRIDCIVKLLCLFGGTISRHKRGKDTYNPTVLDYQWRVTGPRALGVAMALYQLMSPYNKGRILKLVMAAKGTVTGCGLRQPVVVN